MEWIKYNPSQIHDEIFELDGNSTKLFHLMLKTQFENENGFEIVENDDENLTKTSEKACKKMNLSKGNAKRISHILTTFYQEIDNFLWHYSVYDSYIKTIEKSGSASRSANARWQKEKQKKDANASKAKMQIREEKTREEEIREEKNINPLSDESVLPPSKEKKAKVKKEDFNQFWEAYPKKVSKADAEKKFEKALSETTLNELLAGVRKYVKHIQATKTEPQFIKNPSTWLSQGCWNDELESTKTQGKSIKDEWKDYKPSGKYAQYSIENVLKNA